MGFGIGLYVQQEPKCQHTGRGKAEMNGQTASSFANLTIPASGVLTLAPRDKEGDDDF